MGGFIRRVVERVGIDKVAHFSVSAFLTLGIAYFFPVWVAVVIVTTVGFGKEYIDYKNGGKFDWKDIQADMLGIITATVIQLLSSII